MMTRTILSAAGALALALGPVAAAAQSPAPMPASSAPAVTSPQPMQAPPMETTAPQTAAPQATAQPAGAPPPVHTMAPRPSPGAANAATAKVKQIPAGSLTFPQVRYALLHPAQEAKQVHDMKTVPFEKLRVYRLSSALKTMLKVSDVNADIPVLAVLGPGVQLAQTSPLPASNGSNSPIQYLHQVLANINVSNALNNVSVLNGANVNVGVSLQDVLNGNKITIGSVAGIFVNSLGIITTITK